MPVRLVDQGWSSELAQAVRSYPGELRIICPFIKAGALERLLSHRPQKVQVITRFNLTDFAERVSDIAALRKLLDIGAKVRGIQNLHAKLYIFGGSKVIITSCNLTEAALVRNHEIGLIVEDEAVIAKCLEYFDNLWQRATSDLLHQQVDAWDKKVTDFLLEGGHPTKAIGLDDFGADVGIPPTPPSEIPSAITDASQAFIKLLGSTDDRDLLSATTISQLEDGGCHWAVCYSSDKRVKRIEDDDVIFMGRLTKHPRDIRIYGIARAMAYKAGRDYASPAEKEHLSWKHDWPFYIRVHHAEFVDGTLNNGISLNEMMNTLEANSFASTQHNAKRGEGNTNPRISYQKHPDIRLSDEGFLWLNERLHAAFEVHGKISQSRIHDLGWPEIPAIPSSLP